MTAVVVTAAVVLLAGIMVAVRVRRRWVVVKVRGESMQPALQNGDAVLVRRCSADKVAVGDIVVVEAPGRDRRWTTPPLGSRTGDRAWLVKRVAAVVPPHALVVLGDNRATSGQDSLVFGPLPAERLLGVVVVRRPPPRS